MDDNNTGQAGKDTQAGGADPAPAAQGTGTPPVTTGGGAQAQTPAQAQAPAAKFTDADMERTRKSVEAETRKRVKEEAEAAALAEQGKFKELLDKEQAAHKAALAELRQARTETAARDLAAEIGIRADRARQALLLVQGQIEYDDAGRPTNLEKLLRDLLKSTPEWSTQANPTSAGGPTNAARQPGGAALSREAIEKMTPTEINARWAEISAWLAQNNGAG